LVNYSAHAGVTPEPAVAEPVIEEPYVGGAQGIETHETAERLTSPPEEKKDTGETAEEAKPTEEEKPAPGRALTGIEKGVRYIGGVAKKTGMAYLRLLQNGTGEIEDYKFVFGSLALLIVLVGCLAIISFKKKKTHGKKNKFRQFVFVFQILFMISLFFYLGVVSEDIKVEQAGAEIKGHVIQEIEELPSPISDVQEEGIQEIRMITLEINGKETHMFEPSSADIKPGTKVVWKVKDDRNHIINCYEGSEFSFRSKALSGEDTFERTFYNKKEYVCIDVIYSIKGKIRVID